MNYFKNSKLLNFCFLLFYLSHILNSLSAQLLNEDFNLKISNHDKTNKIFTNSNYSISEPRLPTEPKEPFYPSSNNNSNTPPKNVIKNKKTRFKPNLPNFSELRKKATKISIQKTSGNKSDTHSNSNTNAEKNSNYVIDFNLEAEKQKLEQLQKELFLASSSKKLEHATYLENIIKTQTQKIEILGQLKELLSIPNKTHKNPSLNNLSFSNKLNELLHKLYQLDPDLANLVASNSYSINTLSYSSKISNHNLNTNESMSYKNGDFYKPSKFKSFYLEIKKLQNNSDESNNKYFKKVGVTNE